jgi:hypothetical protein
MVKIIGNSVVKSDALSAAKSKEVVAGIRKSLQVVFAKEYATSSGNAVMYFNKRQREGFDISARVWDLAGQKRAEIADSVSAAIADGTSAKDMAKTLTKFLNEPDKIFRRVRDKNGKLVESQVRKDYKESKANAFRLARTEVNMSYKTADMERWQQQDFVKGYRVKLSNNPNHCDFCANLQGVYPKTFLFVSWHPQCRCSCIPILLSASEYDQYEDYILGIGNRPTVDYIESIPVGAANYIKANADKINAYSKKPYWVSDNPQFVTQLLKKTLTVKS